MVELADTDERLRNWAAVRSRTWAAFRVRSATVGTRATPAWVCATRAGSTVGTETLESSAPRFWEFNSTRAEALYSFCWWSE